MNDAACALFLDFSSTKLTQMNEHLAACLARLTEEQVWEKDGPHENAVGNLILHLCGNARQWIVHGIAGAPDIRVRDAEFQATGGSSGADLLNLFTTTINTAKEVIDSLPHERLTEVIHPQNNDVTVLGAIYQVVGHMQQHIGQVIVTKQMTAGDLDLIMPRPR